MSSISYLCCLLYWPIHLQLFNLYEVVHSELACPDGFSFYKDSQKCFLVEQSSDKLMSQMKARLICANKNAFLASIESYEENNFIKDLLLDKDVKMAYIGLQSVPYKVSHRYFCDGTKLEYTHWMPGKPDNGDLKDDGCVVIDVQEGQWDDWTCNVNPEIGISAAVCQIKYEEAESQDNTKCIEGFEYCPSTKNCYKVITTEKAMNQTEAKNICQNYNAHLVSIDSEDENQFISDLAMKHPLSAMRVFIGLESEKTGTNNSKRYWVDGTATTYVKWEHMKPDNEPYHDSDCVVMIPERDGVWNNWACDKTCCTNHSVYGAICEIDL